MDSLIQIDHSIFTFVNQTMSNPLLDYILPLFRNPYFWSPLYLFLLVWMWQQFRSIGLFWCLFFFLTFVFSDTISASFIKPLVHRLRPCNDPYWNDVINNVVRCGVGYSFPSAHATNHFGMSAFIFYTIGTQLVVSKPLAILWASLVGFAQVYVGVHYPSDILGGALLGWLIGFALAKYFLRKWPLFHATKT